MTSHLGLLVLFAFFVSLIFATITKDTPREQVRFGLSLLGGFIAVAVVVGWVMRLFPL